MGSVMERAVIYVVSDKVTYGAWRNTAPVNYSRNGFSEFELSWWAYKGWF